MAVPKCYVVKKAEYDKQEIILSPLNKLFATNFCLLMTTDYIDYLNDYYAEGERQ